jgi:hypothetical protein
MRPIGLALLAAGTLHAQTPAYTGRYLTPDQTGGTVVLVLQQAGGAVTGTLSGTNVAYTLNGVLQEGSVFGTVTGPGIGLYFTAELSGAQLTLTLFEPGPDNRPNYDRGQTMAFTRQGDAAPAAGLPAPPMGATPLLGAAPPAAPPATGARRAIEHWNISYALPAGWQPAQQTGRLHTLSSGSSQGSALYVAAGMYRSFGDVGADLNKGFAALGLTGMPMGQPVPSTIQGMQAMTATYAGQNQMGTPFQARAVAVLTPHGTGLVVTGIAAQQLMSQVGPAVDAIARSIAVGGPARPNSQAIAALRGRWMYYAGRADGVTSASGGASRSHEEFVEFDGQGNYSYQSSSSVSVTTPGLTGTAGGAQATNDAGTYTVIGNTLIVRGRAGQFSFDLQMLPDRFVADGRTYLRAN